MPTKFIDAIALRLVHYHQKGKVKAFMSNIYVNFDKIVGKVRPMHAVNNGPSCDVKGRATGWSGRSSNGNLQEFIDAGIPYARTHDASFYPKYGASHTVDIGAVFPDFDKDPYNPASYDFTCTDNYMDMIEAGGSKIFYRLGSRIEHEIKKYGTLPPKDFKKWAIICEHIIRHYTEGWADGSCRDVEYWEIWNEPDLDTDDSPNKRTWGGTREQFFELYHIAATHLKEKFPHLKIGGPAVALRWDWVEEFLSTLKAPLDFFSWHTYASTPEKFKEHAIKVRELLDKNGFTEAESILNEWNYVRKWSGTEYKYSRIVAKKAKGAAFNLSSMIECHGVGVNMLMYYDARPCGWNGLFDMESLDSTVTTAYYSIPMFNALYKLGNEVESRSDVANVYVMAARGEGSASAILTYYNDDDDAAEKHFSIEMRGLGKSGETQLEVYLLDDNNACTLLERVTFCGEKIILEKDIPNYTSYLFKLQKLE